jgi:hypothetical protein
MRRPVELTLWTAIAAVAVFDVTITWRLSTLARHCEMNPVAAVIIESWGMPAATIYRALLLLFAFVMSRTRTKYSKYVLPVWLMAHVFLVLFLIANWQQLQQLTR